MAAFRVLWKPSAQRELKKLPREAIPRVLAAVEALAADPHPPGARKLAGADRTWRLRVGDYRVIYGVEREVLVVEVIRVGHRREVYRP